VHNIGAKICGLCAKHLLKIASRFPIRVLKKNHFYCEFLKSGQHGTALAISCAVQQQPWTWEN
jgi:hypothetical protein